MFYSHLLQSMLSNILERQCASSSFIMWAKFTWGGSPRQNWPILRIIPRRNLLLQSGKVDSEIAKYWSIAFRRTPCHRMCRATVISTHEYVPFCHSSLVFVENKDHISWLRVKSFEIYLEKARSGVNNCPSQREELQKTSCFLHFECYAKVSIRSGLLYSDWSTSFLFLICSSLLELMRSSTYEPTPVHALLLSKSICFVTWLQLISLSLPVAARLQRYVHDQNQNIFLPWPVECIN